MRSNGPLDSVMVTYLSEFGLDPTSRPGMRVQVGIHLKVSAEGLNISM